jgi:16S rRNA (adenine1518-N6/adenine1519-N6)-dimethyltransferase
MLSIFKLFFKDTSPKEAGQVRLSTICYNYHMDSVSSKNPKSLLKQYQARPSKRFGQNFLADRGIVRKIVEAAEITGKDTVLEIGPGTGELTREIVKAAGKVIAVEKDPRMVQILKGSLRDVVNLKIVQGDIRRLDIRECGIKEDDYKAVGNLPFYLTAPAIRRFLESEKPPSSMTLVVQKEVGQRICQKPPRMNLLSVSVQAYAEPKIIFYISKKSFWPQPEVDAALIKITPKDVPIGDTGLFFKIVKAGFSQPRKQLGNNLSKKLGLGKNEAESWLKANGIEPSRRAETLSLQEWMKLAEGY